MHPQPSSEPYIVYKFTELENGNFTCYDPQVEAPSHDPKGNIHIPVLDGIPPLTVKTVLQEKPSLTVI